MGCLIYKSWSNKGYKWESICKAYGDSKEYDCGGILLTGLIGFAAGGYTVGEKLMPMQYDYQTRSIVAAEKKTEYYKIPVCDY